MKHRLLIFGLALAIVLVGSAQLIHSVKAHSEQRQERIERELNELLNGIRTECKFQFPHSIIERAKCYQNMMVNV